jgi:hypothetical protein
MNKPFYQRAIIWLGWVLGGFLGLGAILGAVDDAIALITFPITCLGTVSLLIVWVFVALLVKLYPITWVTGNDSFIIK